MADHLDPQAREEATTKAKQEAAQKRDKKTNAYTCEWEQDTLEAIKHLTQDIKEHAKYVKETMIPAKDRLKEKLDKLIKDLPQQHMVRHS
jgi:hypothetical protein